MKNLLPGEGADEAREPLRPVAQWLRPQWLHLSAMGGLLGCRMGIEDKLRCRRPTGDLHP